MTISQYNNDELFCLKVFLLLSFLIRSPQFLHPLAFHLWGILVVDVTLLHIHYTNIYTTATRTQTVNHRQGGANRWRKGRKERMNDVLCI